MKNQQERPLVLMVSMLGAFGSGPLLGTGLACLLAPDSFVAEGIGMFAFPLAFVLGLQAWLGLAIFSAVLHAGRRLFSKQLRRSLTGSSVVVPPGSFVFVPLSVGAGLLAGIVVGLVSDTHALLTSVLLFVAAGALYGAVVWQLARSGYLPFPEPGA
jgi:hypothetical protein